MFSKLAVRGDEIWACGASNSTFGGCVTADVYSGAVVRQFDVPWAIATSALVMNNKFVLSGRKNGASMLADCEAGAQLACRVLTLSDTTYYTAAFVPLTDSVLYVGARGEYAASTVLDSSGAVLSHYIYRALNMKSIALVQSATVANFAGGFVAGTATADSNAETQYLVLGWIHTASGAFSAVYLYPTGGVIRDRTEAVQALAMESTGPDSFIAGGIELSDKSGVYAYMMRTNVLFRNIPYAVRYVTGHLQSRRKLTDSFTQCVVRGIAVVTPAVFLVVDQMDREANKTTASVLKVEARDGFVIQQVRISSEAGSVACSDITSTPTGIVIVCNIHDTWVSTHSVLLYADRSLKFRALPAGFVLDRNATFRAEPVPFKMSALSTTTSKTSVATSTSTYTSDNTSPTYVPTTPPTMTPSTRRPTARPSLAPSWIPSVQGSSGPPAVYAHPTSRPSTVQPTFTLKPSSLLTAEPSVVVTVPPSTQPSARPSPPPTLQPTATPSRTPTHLPSAAPTRKPSIRSTCRPTRTPTLRPTPVSAMTIPPVSEAAPPTGPDENCHTNTTPSYVITVSVVGAVLCVIFGAFLFYRQYSASEEKKFDRLTKIGPSSEHVRAVQKIMRQRATMSSSVPRSINTNAAGNKVAPGPPRVASSGSSSSVAVSSLHSSELSSPYDSDDSSCDSHSSHLSSSHGERSESSGNGDEGGLHLPHGCSSYSEKS